MTPLMTEIKQYLESHDLGYVIYLKGYPKDGNHLEIVLDHFEIRIELGLDQFAYDVPTKLSKSHLWYVSINGELAFYKGFKCYKKAIKESIDEKIRMLSYDLGIYDEMKESINK